VAEEAGTYVLVFDNSYSKLTPKKVTFWAEVKNESEVEEKPDLTGWMLKKKKQAGIKRGSSLPAYPPCLPHLFSHWTLSPYLCVRKNAM